MSLLEKVITIFSRNEKPKIVPQINSQIPNIKKPEFDINPIKVNNNILSAARTLSGATMSISNELRNMITDIIVYKKEKFPNEERESNLTNKELIRKKELYEKCKDIVMSVIVDYADILKFVNKMDKKFYVVSYNTTLNRILEIDSKLNEVKSLLSPEPSIKEVERVVGFLDIVITNNKLLLTALKTRYGR